MCNLINVRICPPLDRSAERVPGGEGPEQQELSNRETGENKKKEVARVLFEGCSGKTPPPPPPGSMLRERPVDLS